MAAENNIEAVLVCQARSCKEAGSYNFAQDLACALKEANSNIRVGECHWCLGGCGGKSIIVFPDGPIYVAIGRNPMDQIINLLVNNQPIEGLKQNNGVGFRYIAKMLGR